ncbi:MAG: GNAT family N-acetyltransferase [Myxococcales bacterium]|nr:GNAT family N-acetyltransferase [Myxococcales bacterium]
MTRAVTIVATRAEHAVALEQLQVTCFPTLAPEQRFRREHYLHHITLFPEGQLVALEGTRVVGVTSSIRVGDSTLHAHHRFDEVFDGGWLGVHEPDGEWLYGVDIGVDPAYRRRGIARALYQARQGVVAALGLRGQVTVGMLSGYGALCETLSAEQYYDELVRGERSDPTVTAQLRVGFEARGLVAGYVDDPVCAGFGVLLVRPR